MSNGSSGLCPSAAEYIGKVELHAIELQDPSLRLNYYERFCPREIMAREGLPASEHIPALKYLRRRIELTRREIE